MPYCLRHVIIIFRDYLLLLNVNVLFLKLDKNTKFHQIDFFLNFTFKPEVHSTAEMFVVTKWLNQVLLSLAYHVQRK